MSGQAWSRSRTWSRSFLWKTTALILAAGLALAALAAALRPTGTPSRPRVPERVPLLEGRGPDALPDPREWLDPWLADEDTDFGDVVDAIPELLLEPAARGASGVAAAVERSVRDPREREIATLLVLARSGQGEALARLAELAAPADAPRHAGLALGHALPPSELSAAAYEREAARHDDERARRHALETYAALGDTVALDRLLGDPAYAAVADATVPLLVARARLDWVGITLWMGPAQHARHAASFVALGVLSGLIWLVFLAYAGEVRSLRSARLALCVAAVLLGAISTIPTLVLSVWMDEVLGVQPSTSLQGGLAYFVASVGLREELCKLVAFLPLAPFVIRRRDPLEMLVVAGCVGLGFAAEENISYFSRSGGADAAGRFLTANFGHVVDTGLIGFFFCRMWIEKRVTDFLLVFVLVVIGHGVYDALILVPALEPYAELNGIIYVAVAFVYFGELRKHASNAKRRVPLTAVFAYGCATLLAATLVAASFELGLGQALKVIIPATLGAALFVFVFFRQMEEPLLP